MELYEKNGNILYILNVLKKYSDEEHMLSVTEIKRKIQEIYNIEIDPRTIRRNINLLKYKLNFDISTREKNGKGYYINKDPDTDFEPGEIRAIIDTFSYANYIVPSIAKEIINKCKNHDYKVTPNDIYILYKINKKEAEEGCVKKLKIKRKKWDNKAKRIVTRKDTIKITIPKGIQDSQSIIIYGEGNQDKTSNSGNLILNIKVI